jgi:transposase
MPTETPQATESNGREYRDEQWLREQYIEQKLSIRGVAANAGVSRETIRRWLKKHGIEARDKSASQGVGNSHALRDRAWLYEQYVKKQQSTTQIASKTDVSYNTVNHWLRKHGIEIRDRSGIPNDSPLRNADWLREQYVANKRGIRDIADELGRSETTVDRWIQKHGIDRRGREWPRGKDHPDWNGGGKRYGPGWNRTKRATVRERDGMACVACGMTQQKHQREYDEKLHVHHLIKARDIDDPEERNAVENLITLCRDCHREWERLSEAGIRPQIAHAATD